MHPPAGQQQQQQQQQQQHDETTAMNLPRVLACRHWIMLLSGFGLMISYADRSNMAVAIVAIAREHGYTKPQQGLILASFFFGYILTPIMGGTLADRYGGKSVLAFGALVWTIFTFLIPWVSGLGIFWVVLARIGLGLGEGVAYPSIHAMIGTWIPPSERSKAVATVTAFAYLGSVIALPTSSALVVSSWGWRSIFWVFGTLGFLWSIAWQIWGASDPTTCSWISEHEKHWILHQQHLDLPPDGTIHYLGVTRFDSRESTDREHGHEHVYDQQQVQMTLGSHGAPVAYQSLSSTNLEIRPSEDSQNEIQATSSSRHSNSDENELVFRSDAGAAASKMPTRWQAFRDEIRAKSFQRRDMNTTKKAAVPWRELLVRREVWAIIVSQLFNSLGFFVMQSWIPTFYLDFYGVDVGKIGYYAVVPSAVQGIMGLFSGYLGDKAILNWGWSTLTVRRAGQSVGSLGLGVFLLIAVTFAHTAPLAMTLITIGMAMNGFTMIGASAYQHDFCPQHAGFIFSLGNTAGSIPALIGVFLVGVLLDSSGKNRWMVVWTAVCGFYVLGTVAFVFLSTSRKFPHTLPIV